MWLIFWTSNSMLLDANVLIALFDASHVHHVRCSNWFSSQKRMSLCALTELSVLRWGFRVDPKNGRGAAVAFLEALSQKLDYLDQLPRPMQLDWNLIYGHKQVTDSFLVQIAKQANQRVATLDRGLFAVHGECVLLINAEAN
jgi:uncharacterized protein